MNGISMTCELCGSSKARLRQVTRTYGEGDDLLVIEDVPVISCSSCGESYMTSETALEIERLKTHRHALAVGRKVEVVKFEAA